VKRPPTASEEATNRGSVLRGESFLVIADLLDGFVHELNSPLTILLGQSVVLQEHLADTPDGVRAGRIARASERCARLAREFTSLAREAPRDVRLVEVNPIVQETLFLFEYALTTGRVELRLSLEPALPALKAEPRDLRLIVATLVGCALYALRAEGTPVLTVTTRKLEDPARLALEIDHNGSATPPRTDARSRRTDEERADEPSVYLATQLAAQVGGTLRCELAPAPRFTVELPPASVRARS
jgi:signal transduction histidine kinase